MKNFLNQLFLICMCMSWSLMGMDKEDIEEKTDNNDNGVEALIEIVEIQDFKPMKKLLESLCKTGENVLDSAYLTDYPNYVKNINKAIDDAFYPHNTDLKIVLHPDIHVKNSIDYCKIQNLFLESNRFMNCLLIMGDIKDPEKKELYEDLMKFKAKIAEGLKRTISPDSRDLRFSQKFRAILDLENKSVSWGSRLYNYIHNTVNTAPAALRDQDIKNCINSLNNSNNFTDEQSCYVALYILTIRQLRYFIQSKIQASAWQGHFKVGALGVVGLLGLALLPRLFTGKESKDVKIFKEMYP